MINTLRKMASGRRVLTLFIATMALYLFILLYTIPTVTARAPDRELFDMSPGGYDLTYAGELLEAIGEEGRDSYLRLQLPVDFIYPGLFAVSYTLMLFWLFGKSVGTSRTASALCFVPALAGLFDYCENIGIILMLRSFPDLSPRVVKLSSLFSVLKSMATIAFYLLLMGGLILLAIKRIRLRK